ncbi:MAG: hypothetical protein AAGG46_02865, partial [Planctomycetota bacterium]
MLGGVGGGGVQGGGLLGQDPNADTTQSTNQPELVQHLLPTTFSFVEVYNPNGPDAQLPAELYLDQFGELPDIDGDGNPDEVRGVRLDKQTNGFIGSLVDDTDNDGNPDAVPQPDQQRSPVWRMIVVEEHPEIRNDYDGDDATQNGQANPGGDVAVGTYRTETHVWEQVPSGYFAGVGDPALRGSMRLLDPDFPGFNRFDRPLTVRAELFNDPTSGPESGLQITVADTPAYIEREVFFTFAERIPVRAFAVENLNPPGETDPPGTPDLSAVRTAGYIDQSFVKTNGFMHGSRIDDGDIVDAILPIAFTPRDSNNLDGDAVTDGERLPLAPILPGRYGVIGTSGFLYERDQPNAKYAGAYVNPIGRLDPLGGVEQNPLLNGNVDENQQGTQSGSPNGNAGGTVVADPFNADYDPKGVRRIDLVPHPNPDFHQVLVTANGGPEFDLIGAASPAAGNDRRLNVTNPLEIPPDADLFAEVTRESYSSRPDRFNIAPVVAIPVDRFTLGGRLDNYLGRSRRLITVTEEAARQDNNNQNDGDIKFSFDVAEGEGGFSRLGQQGTIDEPVALDGVLDRVVDPLGGTRTVPAFRSVHLQRLANPLLVWNPRPGEDKHDPRFPVNPYLTVDSLAVDVTSINGTAQFDDQQLAQANNPVVLRSTERNLDPTDTGDRRLWSHRPRTTAAQMTSDDARLIASDKLLAGNTALDRLDEDSQPEPHYFPYAIRHSLGYGSVRFERSNGYFQRLERLYTADLDNDPENFDDSAYDLDLNGDGVGGDVVGSPQIDRTNASDTDDATYPWLTWNNRPFISAHELLQVPAGSGSVMMRDFSTFDTDADLTTAAVERFNPYDGDAIFNDAGNDSDEFDAADDRVTAFDNNTAADTTDDADAANTDAARHRAQQAPFGHLLNFFQSATRTAAAEAVNGELVAAGAPNFHRLLDYV